MRQAKDALATAVEDMEQNGEALPPSVEEDSLPSYDRSAFHDPRTLLVPVEATGRALRVNVSLDEGLLARIDDVSKRTGLSRSALLARGARMLIATELNSWAPLQPRTHSAHPGADADVSKAAADGQED